MPAATTTHCYSTEDQDSTFQATGLPVGDYLGQAGREQQGWTKPQQALHLWRFPAAMGNRARALCVPNTINPNSGDFWLLTIPYFTITNSQRLGRVHRAYVFQFFTLILPQLQDH